MSRNVPENLTPTLKKHKTTTKKDAKNFRIRFIHPMCKSNGIITNEFITTTEEKAVKKWLREWPGLMKCDIVSIDIIPLKYEQRLEKMKKLAEAV